MQDLTPNNNAHQYKPRGMRRKHSKIKYRNQRTVTNNIKLMHVKRGFFGEEYEDTDGTICNNNERCKYRGSGLETECFEQISEISSLFQNRCDKG